MIRSGWLVMLALFGCGATADQRRAAVAVPDNRAEVRIDNRTTLEKTRVHPYAIYIARMHRNIHDRWALGFLKELENKPADHPLNDPELWTNLELAVNPDGTLHKVAIARTSRNTEFDVAAIDAVISAAPYEATPEATRSVDGRTYLRWALYRDSRECATFGVEPYILTDGASIRTAPSGGSSRHPTRSR